MAEKKIKTAPSGPVAFIANTSFAWNGVTIVAGQTVAAGHPLLKGKAKLFRPFEPTYPLPAAAKPKAASAPQAKPAHEPEPEPGKTPESEPTP